MGHKLCDSGLFIGSLYLMGLGISDRASGVIDPSWLVTFRMTYELVFIHAVFCHSWAVTPIYMSFMMYYISLSNPWLTPNYMCVFFILSLCVPGLQLGFRVYVSSTEPRLETKGHHWVIGSLGTRRDSSPRAQTHCSSFFTIFPRADSFSLGMIILKIVSWETVSNNPLHKYSMIILYSYAII